jgi:hypothetical protein
LHASGWRQVGHAAAIIQLTQRLARKNPGEFRFHCRAEQLELKVGLPRISRRRDAILRQTAFAATAPRDKTAA